MASLVSDTGGLFFPSSMLGYSTKEYCTIEHSRCQEIVTFDLAVKLTYTARVVEPKQWGAEQ